MKLTLYVWRQNGPDDEGRHARYEANDISEHMSFLEMLDLVNERLTEEGDRLGPTLLEDPEVTFTIRNRKRPVAHIRRPMSGGT